MKGAFYHISYQRHTATWVKGLRMYLRMYAVSLRQRVFVNLSHFQVRWLPPQVFQPPKYFQMYYSQGTADYISHIWADWITAKPFDFITVDFPQGHRMNFNESPSLTKPLLRGALIWHATGNEWVKSTDISNDWRWQVLTRVDNFWLTFVKTKSFIK